MNILFITSLADSQSLAKPFQTPEYIQFGISYISAFLKSHGHKTELIVLSSNFSVKENRKIVHDHLKDFNPGLICFTSVTTEYSFITGIAKYIRSLYPDMYLLIGGCHVSLNPDGILQDGYDALCLGEGEYPTLELVSMLAKGESPSGISNLWINHESGVEKNALRPFIEDIDRLPFPDRDMWNDWIENRVGSKFSLLLGRGCPFQCTYCSNHALKKLTSGSYVRFRSPDNVIAELKELIAVHPEQKEIYFEVETIAINRKWALEFLSKLEAFNASLPRPLSFGTNLRITPNADLEWLFKELKRCNFRYLQIGIESGSERVRKEILKRNYSNKDIIKTAELARKYGLRIAFFNLIGVPGETVEDFKETVRVNRTCLPDWNYTSIFFPYPGTDLYFKCRERGLLTKNVHTSAERAEATLDFPEFSRKQIQKSYIWFDYYVYKGHKPMYTLLLRVFRSKLRSKPFLNSLYRKVTGLVFFRSIEKYLKKMYSSQREFDS
jgi:anaerobic magnesium-protoporphyrin IX monomethyl ester cyclase